jgi:Holliday junction resolvase RusA-like endonuclease
VIVEVENDRPGYLLTSPGRWKRVLSPNARVHWRTRAECMAKDKERVCFKARAHRQSEPFTKATVSIELYVPRHYRRDADNTLAALKGVFDGLVAGGVIADDSMDVIGIPDVRWVVNKELAYGYRVTVTEGDAP